MAVFAAFGGSTNLVLHLPAIAYSASLPRPTLEDWIAVNRRVPRLVSVLPNGPVNHSTSARLPGGRRARSHAPSAGLGPAGTGRPHGQRPHAGRSAGVVGEVAAPRRPCAAGSGIAMASSRTRSSSSPARARELGVTSTICFPRGNLAPGGSIIKSTAIDPRVLDADGVYRKTGPARVFMREKDAIAAFKGQGAKPLRPGDVLVLMGRGPAGSGMEEVFQLTAALKYLSWGREVAVLTDARFSGVSTGACIGWVTPEALAGGPLGKVRDGDRIRIVIDPQRLEGSVDLVGDASMPFSPEEAEQVLQQRTSPPRACARPGLAVRYAAVGRAATRQRRAVGRLRFRRGSDRGEARLIWFGSEVLERSWTRGRRNTPRLSDAIWTGGAGIGREPSAAWSAWHVENLGRPCYTGGRSNGILKQRGFIFLEHCPSAWRSGTRRCCGT